MSCTRACADGEYGQTTNGTAACIPCPPGSRCADGAKTACRAGSFQDESKQAECKLCLARHFGRVSNQTHAECSGLCPAGHFCPTGTKDPIPCPIGTVCAVGAEAPTVLMPCLPGAYEANASDLSPARCQPCAAGTISVTTNAAACVACPSSAFQPAVGKGFCLPHTNCIKGERETAAPSAAADRKCAACVPGSFSTMANVRSCETCPLGKHQALGGQTSCGACTAGKRGKTGGCEPCAAGFFQNAMGKTQCVACSSIACPHGAPRKGCGGASGGYCGTCSPGTFIDGSACRICGAGQFSAVENAPKCEPCPSSSYQPLSGTGFCLPHVVCAAGKHVLSQPNATSKGSCEPCAEGFFQNATGQAQCIACSSVACPNGAHRRGCRGASEGYCGTCSPGTFIDGSSCAKCAAGHFSATENVAACEPCEDASFQPEAGKGFCLPHIICARGERVTSAPSATADRACARCPVKHYGNATNAAGCERCPSGKYQNEEGQPFCETYSEGFAYRVDNKTNLVEKQQCPPGYRCNGASQERCENKKSNPATGKCVSCEDKEFANTHTNRCIGCPTLGTNSSRVAKGVVCKDGGISIDDDFYVEGAGAGGAVPLSPDMRVLKCRGSGVCQTAVNKTDFTVRTTCAPDSHTAGVLCGACAAGYAKGQGACVECATDGGAAPVLLLLGALVVFGLLYRACISTALKHAQRGHKSEFMTFSLLKIGMAFLFQTSLLARFNLDWGGLVTFLFQLNGAASSGDPTKLASAECFGLDLHAKTKLMFAAPFIVMLLPLPMLLKARLTQRTTVFGVPPPQAFYASVLIGWWLLHPAVLAHCVVTLLTLTVSGKEYALADLSVETTDPAYQQSRRLALALMATFVPAVPLYIFGQLYRWREALRSDGIVSGLMPEGPRVRLFYFYGSYAPARYYWEGVVFAVRTAMVLLASLSSTYVEHGMLQLIVFLTTWVTLIHFLFVFKCRPYAHSAENRVNNVTQGALLALLLSALGMSLEDAKQENSYLENLLRVFCAVQLIGTICVVGSSFTGQCMHKVSHGRKEKKKNKEAALMASQEQLSAQDTTGSAPEQRAADGIPMFDNPMHGEGGGGADADGGAAAAAAAAVAADRESLSLMGVYSGASGASGAGATAQALQRGDGSPMVLPAHAKDVSSAAHARIQQIYDVAVPTSRPANGRQDRL